MFWHNFAALAAVFPLMLAEVDARAAPCWQAGELAAARLHEFKTMLLVGAMKCSDRAPGALESYNKFVNQKRDMILSSASVVKARFIRDAGTSVGEDDFTNYETGIGNRFSSMAHDDAFCAKIGTYSRLAASASEEDVGVLAGVAAPAPSADPCGSQARPMGDSRTVAAVQPAIMSKSVPVDTVRAASADAAAVPPVPAGASSAAEVAASPPAPVPAMLSDDPGARAPTPSAAQALAEAAKALAAAAAALEAQRPTSVVASKPN